MLPADNSASAFAHEHEQIDVADLLTVATMGGDIGVWECDCATRRFHAEPTLLDMLGLDDRDCPIDIESWLQNVALEHRPKATAEARALLNVDCESPRKVERVRRMIHKDGNERVFLSRVVCLPAPRGRSARLVGAEIDITSIVKPSSGV